MNTVVNTEQKTTVKDELGNVAQETVSNIKELLRAKKVGNEKMVHPVNRYFDRCKPNSFNLKYSVSRNP